MKLEKIYCSAAGNGVPPMNAIDVANGYKRMLEMRGYKLSAPDSLTEGRIGNGLSELARDLGISHSRISKDLDLLNEPKEVIKSIQKGTPKSFYTEMKEVPEVYKPELREAINKNQLPPYERLRRQLAENLHQK